MTNKIKVLLEVRKEVMLLDGESID